MSVCHGKPNLTSFYNLTKSAKRRCIKKMKKYEMQGNTGREQKETKTKIGRKIKKSNQQAMAGFAVQGELSNHTFTSGCGHGWREPTRLTCSEAGVNDPPGSVTGATGTNEGASGEPNKPNKQMNKSVNPMQRNVNENREKVHEGRL